MGDICLSVGQACVIKQHCERHPRRSSRSPPLEFLSLNPKVMVEWPDRLHVANFLSDCVNAAHWCRCRNARRGA